MRPLATANPRRRRSWSCASAKRPRAAGRCPSGSAGSRTRRSRTTCAARCWSPRTARSSITTASTSRSCARRSRANWEEGRFTRGASTITQQLAKNLYLSPSRNPIRKLKELLITRRLEAALTKRRILEIYLNVIEWGDGIFGAEAAARAYFGKSASALTPEEAALLAGAIINPREHSPAHPTARLLRRQQIIARRMGIKPRETRSADRQPMSSQLTAHPSSRTAPFGRRATVVSDKSHASGASASGTNRAAHRAATAGHRRSTPVIRRVLGSKSAAVGRFCRPAEQAKGRGGRGLRTVAGSSSRGAAASTTPVSSRG